MNLFEKFRPKKNKKTTCSNDLYNLYKYYILFLYNMNHINVGAGFSLSQSLRKAFRKAFPRTFPQSHHAQSHTSRAAPPACVWTLRTPSLVMLLPRALRKALRKALQAILSIHLVRLYVRENKKRYTFFYIYIYIYIYIHT